MPQDSEEEAPRDNRTKKVAGRAKRRRYVQGTRAYLHAVTNATARRAREAGAKAEEEHAVGPPDRADPSDGA